MSEGREAVSGSCARPRGTPDDGRECGCPEWVVMCVHLPSGERLMLAVSDVHQCKCIDEAVGFQAVISSNAPFEVCTLCGTGARLWNREITVIGRFHDRAEAEAAFRAEEQRIIKEVFGG